MHKNKFTFLLYLQLNFPAGEATLARNWLCNGGMALELSLLYPLDLGSADLPVDFRWVSDIQHSAVLQCPSLQVPLPRQLAGRGGAGGGLLLQ